MAAYLLDTNHLSPLVTLNHPLRHQILGPSKPDIPLLSPFRPWWRCYLGLACYPERLKIGPSGNGFGLILNVTSLMRPMPNERRVSKFNYAARVGSWARSMP